MKDRLFEIWFSLRCGIANTEFQAVLDRFGTPYDVFNADETELERLPVSPRLREALADKSLQESSRIMEFCRRSGVGILFFSDELYPESLRPLRDPPVLLYYRGCLPALSHRLCISVVGTRRMSEYGKRMAYKIGYELASAGAVVVSGMALGNDSVAAAGAIAAGGETVAVLGSGIDVIYPKEHDRFFDAIAKRGVIFTEYPPGTPPVGAHFPVRNRIISGLSQGTLVVEGHMRSGALITARTAILQGRDIYAVPGNVGETNSAGTNHLIADGAAVALGARDVLENYTFLYRDALNMTRFEEATRRSELDASVLDRLGVYTRTEKPTEPTAGDAPPPAPSPAPPPTPKRRPSPRSSRKNTDTPPPEASAMGKAPPPAEPARGDNSRRILESLSPAERAVFDALPLDRSVPLDYLASQGLPMAQIMAAVTILEIKGLILTLPGGLVGRK